MDNPVLIIKAPILDDASAASVHQLLTDLAAAFEFGYYKQIKRYYECANHFYGSDCYDNPLGATQNTDSFYNDEIPF